MKINKKEIIISLIISILLLFFLLSFLNIPSKSEMKLYAIRFVSGVNIKDPLNVISSPDEKYATIGSGDGWAIYDFEVIVNNVTIKFHGKGDGLLDAIELGAKEK